MRRQQREMCCDVVSVNILRVDLKDSSCLLLMGMTWNPHLRPRANTELNCRGSNRHWDGYVLVAQLPLGYKAHI